MTRHLHRIKSHRQRLSQIDTSYKSRKLTSITINPSEVAEQINCKCNNLIQEPDAAFVKFMMRIPPLLLGLIPFVVLSSQLDAGT